MKKNLLTKFLLVSFASLALSFHATAQIAAGDIAILGVNADAVDIDNDPLYNELTIATLADIPSGQTVYISDYAYDGNALVTTGPVTSEGVITWTTTSLVPKGTVIKITINGDHVIDGGLTNYGSVSASGWEIDIDTDGTGDAIASGGDNWFIFTGSVVNPQFVYGFGNWSTSISGLNWLSAGVPSSTTSYLPASLTNGLTANLQNSTNHADNNVYSGPKSGSKFNLLTAFTNTANWTKSETVIQDINPGGAVLGGTNPILNVSPTEINIVSTLMPFESCVGSPSVAQIISVSGNGLSESIVLKAPAGFEISTNGINYTSTLSLSQTSGTVTATDIYIRIAAATNGTPNGIVEATSFWATTQFVSVSGVVNAIPSLPTLTSDPICGEGTVTFNTLLSRQKGSISPYKLYDALTGGNLVATELTTPTISETSTFYASVTVNNCESPREAVVATVNQPTSETITEVVCESYNFNGTDIFESGVYKDTIPNAVGCDSVITLNLTVNYIPQFTLQPTDINVCLGDSFEISMGTLGDDLTYKLYLSSNKIDFEFGGSEIANSSKYLAESNMFSGAYLVFTAENTCGIDTSDFVLYNVNQVDTSVTASINKLTANYSSATSYQWINCSDYSVIDGATSQVFTPAVSGFYAVIVTTANCADTSSCHAVDFVTGLDKFNSAALNVYPNPASDVVHIVLTSFAEGVVSIVDIHGNVVATKSTSGKEWAISTADIANGVYTLKITTDTITSTKQIVIVK
jgi:hypothetical protein